MADPTPDPEAQALAGRLKAAREAAHLPQDAVAPVIRVPRSGVSDLERGTRAVGALELGRLAALYEVPLETLLYGDETPALTPWSHRSVYAAGMWRRLPKRTLELIGERAAYEGDGLEVFTIGEGPTNDGPPHLGVWQRSPEAGLEELPLFELSLVAGPMHVLVYVATRGDLLHLLRELAPLVRDLHAAQLDAVRLLLARRQLAEAELGPLEGYATLTDDAEAKAAER
jgi:transcriptional regulator with XRE-family HTH domain